MTGGTRFCMPLVDECNTVSHNRARGSGEYLLVGKEGAWTVMGILSSRLQSSPFLHPVLSGATAFNIKVFEGLSMSSYTLGRWGKSSRS